MDLGKYTPRVAALVLCALALVGVGGARNWVTDDRLVIGVSYRESQGEKYRLLAVNGLAGASQSDEQSDYTSVGGTSSTGEFVTQLKELFDDVSRTDFKFVDE